MSQMPPPPAPPPGYGGQPPYGNPPPPPPPGYGPPQAYGQPVPAPRTSGAAVGALVCGILGCLGITALIAIVLGVVGIRNTGKPGVRGRGMAVAGLVLGVLLTVAWGVAGGVGVALYNASKPSRAAAKQFAAYLDSGNLSAAQAMCTSQVAPNELQNASQKLRAWGGVQDTTLGGFNLDYNAGQSTAFAVGAIHLPNNDSAAYAVQFIKENGVLKVQGFTIDHRKTNEVATGGNPPNRQPGSGQSRGSSSSGGSSSGGSPGGGGGGSDQ